MGANPISTSGTRYYQLRQSCCLELNITLCLQHLATRLKSGWTLDKDRGADAQACYDCKAAEDFNPPQ